CAIPYRSNYYFDFW
nr:immunoglobulin heavy chain junction region [Macaca mulatta]